MKFIEFQTDFGTIHIRPETVVCIESNNDDPTKTGVKIAAEGNTYSVVLREFTSVVVKSIEFELNRSDES